MFMLLLDCAEQGAHSENLGLALCESVSAHGTHPMLLLLADIALKTVVGCVTVLE